MNALKTLLRALSVGARAINFTAGVRAAFVLAGFLLAALPVAGAVRYVNVNNLTPLPPYTSWATAATNIQDAVDVTVPGDEVLVTNGVYRTGGRLGESPITNATSTVSNRVTVTNQILMRSVNGPEVTIIEGNFGNYYRQARGVALQNGGVLAGFTITNASGGYIFFTNVNGNNIPYYVTVGSSILASSNSVISNCLIRANSGGAYGGRYFQCTFRDNAGGSLGGGAANATLNHCTLQNNSAQGGGGAYNSVLNHCSLFGNVSNENSFESPGGGGALACVLNNCLLITNSAAGFGGGASLSSLTNCLLIENLAEVSGGGAYLSTLDTCSLFDNVAWQSAGGALESYLTNCVLTGNMAEDGGGAVDSVLVRCNVSENVADDDGGGVRYCDITASTLTGNSANSGGGASESRLTHCTLSGNYALVHGGGAYESVLSNCLLTKNEADMFGGGALGGVLLNCTLVGNSAGSGGGTAQSSVTNSIVYFNTATNGPNHLNSTFNTSCTTPLPVGGFGNISTPPAFIDLAVGNLRLASNSPCLNTGDNAFAAALTDLDGRPRLISGTVDMGAYEFQTNVSGLFIGYLQQYGLPTDGTADTTDSDSDRLNNFQEWRAGTIPTSALSVLRLLTPLPVGTDLVVSWESVPGKTYFLTRSTNLTTGAGFVPLAQNLPGQFGFTSYTDTNAVNGQRHYFYQVGVE